MLLTLPPGAFAKQDASDDALFYRLVRHERGGTGRQRAARGPLRTGPLPRPGAAAIGKVIDRFGRLDVIVNNAGFVASSPKETFDRKASPSTTIPPRPPCAV